MEQIVIDGNTVTFTRSDETIMGFLWFHDGTFETVPFLNNEGYSIKSNLPAGTYKIKEYNANGDVFDVNGDIVIEA